MNYKYYKLKKFFNKKNFILITIPILLILLARIHIDVYKTSTSIATNLLKRTIKRTKSELNLYISPVVNNLMIYKQKGYYYNYKDMNIDEFNRIFIPVIKNSPLVSSVIFSNTTGDEKMLLKEDSTWQNRIKYKLGDSIIIKRIRWKYTNSLQGQKINEWFWDKDTSYKIYTKQWFVEALTNDKPEPAWTNPYHFYTTGEPGISATVKWSSEDTILNFLVFDVLLNGISEYTAKLKIANNGILLITNKDDKTVGLPRNERFQTKQDFLKYSLIKVDSLGLPVVLEARKKWRELREPDIFKFNYNNEKWWCGIDKFKINNNKIFYIITLVPEADFLLEFNYTITFIFVSFIIVLLLMILIIRAYKLQQKLNEELENKNDQIIEQRDEILLQKDILKKQKIELENIHNELKQSIEYSVNIQKSMLPDLKILEDYFSNYFIFYKPKDKISGDFYWWKKIDNKIYITAADCTGHGVPGALLSMIGISALENIITTNAITPNNVLFLLRDYVITKLNQKGKIGERKDGIDMSLIYFDTKTMNLQYAGANNSIYIITKHDIKTSKKLVKFGSNANLKLYEMKADKMPISISDFLRKFNLVEFKVGKGDIIYMFSDGFIDQFGGKTTNGKKYTSKRFKKFLLSIAAKSMKEQEQLIKLEFKKWKGNIEQTDDILVIGIII